MKASKLSALATLITALVIVGLTILDNSPLSKVPTAAIAAAL